MFFFCEAANERSRKRAKTTTKPAEAQTAYTSKTRKCYECVSAGERACITKVFSSIQNSRFHSFHLLSPNRGVLVCDSLFAFFFSLSSFSLHAALLSLIFSICSLVFLSHFAISMQFDWLHSHVTFIIK